MIDAGRRRVDEYEEGLAWAAPNPEPSRATSPEPSSGPNPAPSPAPPSPLHTPSTPSWRRPKPDVTPGRNFFRKRLIYFLIVRGGGLCYYRSGGLRREGERVRQRGARLGRRGGVKGRRERCKTAGYVGRTPRKRQRARVLRGHRGSPEEGCERGARRRERGARRREPGGGSPEEGCERAPVQTEPDAQF